MQNTSSKNGPIVIIILIVVIAVGYYLYNSGNATVDDTLNKIGIMNGDAASADDAIIGAETLALLKRVGSLKIDPNFFNNNQVYQSLVDYTVAIPTWNVGRSNPFAPLPGNVLPISTLASSSRRTGTAR